MKIFLFFLLTIFCFAKGSYIPKTKSEKEILDLYKKEKIFLYLDDKEYKNRKDNNQTFNDIIIEMFEEYLGLDLEVKYVSMDDVRGIDENEILGGVYINNKVMSNIIFSIPFYKEELYLVSEDLEIDLKSLKNEDVLGSELYDEVFKFYLIANSKDLLQDNSKLLKAKKVKKAKLLPKLEALKYENRMRIGELPRIALGISLKNEKLLPILNNAIKEKYLSELTQFFYKKNNEEEKKQFLESLNLEEKEFIEKNQIVLTGLESEQKWSYYLQNDKEYLGALPEVLKKFSFFTGMNFKIQNKPQSSWEELLNLFDQGKIRMLPMIKTNERMKKYIFTSNLEEVILYEVHGLKRVEMKDEMLISVVKESFEESYAKIHYNQKNIRFYKNYKELMKALTEKKINIILSYNIINVSEWSLCIERDKFPVSFAFHPKDYVLRDIIEKALGASRDTDEIIRKGIESEEKNSYEEIINRKKENIGKFILSAVFLAFVFYSIFEIYYKNKKNQDFLKDKLTKLPNYFTYLNEADVFFTKEGQCLKINLSMLKYINNYLGWRIGNDVILEISNLLVRILARECSEFKIYKVAGDKFYIFAKVDDIEKLTKLIKSEIVKLGFEKEYKIKNKIRIAYLKKCKNESVESIFKYLEIIDNNERYQQEKILITKADKLLIEKIERKNKIKKLINEKNIRGVYPVFQPKFDVKTLEVVGAEVLARWETNELGFISPAEFIPMFEELKKIHLVDYLMAEETMNFLKGYEEALNEKKLKLSFNVSLQTFERDDFISTIFDLMQKIGISGINLEIELTESILALNVLTIKEKIEVLKDKDITVSIDDFTAGNSSIALLGILDVDTIKFDKSILDMVKEEGASSRYVYQNLIKLVKGLGFKIVAEGIENDYQLGFLKNNNVDIGQGFLYSKALRLKEFLKFITVK